MFCSNYLNAWDCWDTRFSSGFWTIQDPFSNPILSLLPFPQPMSSSLPSLSSFRHTEETQKQTLTRVWLVAVVTLSEVLWVLNNGDAGHADHHGVRAGIQ